MISGLKLMAPTLIVPSSSSIGMAVTSCPGSLWLEEFLEPRDPFEIFEWLDPMPPDISPLLLNRLEAWMPFWLYFKLRRLNSSSSYQRILRLLDESEKQNINNATYVSVNCYQSKSYNNHQNNDSFQFFVFPCLNIIWKWNWDYQSNYSEGHFNMNLIDFTLIILANLPFIIGNSSVRNLKKSRERRKVPSIVLIAENPLSIKVRL